MSVVADKPEAAKAGVSKWKPINLVSIYKYARTGLPETAMAQHLGMSYAGWKLWKKRHPEIEQAIELGKTDTKDGGNWHKFVYERLPADLREVWDTIVSWDKFPNGVAKIEALLNGHGKLVRQQLFLYALVNFNFSKSKAMSKVCIDKDTLDYWIKNDPDFARLVEEIEWHKDNFFEESLVGLVKGGDTAATIAACRTRLRDRGYGSQVDVNHRHTGHIDHSVLDLDELNLSAACRQEIINALREREEKMQRERTKILQPAEYRVLDEINSEISSGAAEVLNPE